MNDNMQPNNGQGPEMQAPEYTANVNAPDPKKSGSKRALRAGSYSIIVTVVVLAIVVVLNMLVGQLPAMATRWDLTPMQMLDFSEQTEKLVGGLQEQVTLYWLVQSGGENTYVEETLSRYSDLSDKLHVEKKDPVTNPSFASQYTSSTIYNNSVIVVSGNRSKFVSATEIFVTNQNLDGSVTQDYDGEAALTSAIDYVTNSDLPLVYITTGHGELAMEDVNEGLGSAIARQNIMTEKLNLLSVEEVPEDADCVFILSPTKDISTTEKEVLEAYLARGGHLLLMTDYTEEKMPNLTGLMSGYGVDLVDGIVIERNANNSLQNYPHYVIPTMPMHAITEPLINGNFFALMPMAQGLTVQQDLRDGLTVTQILRSTSDSYSKLAAYNMTTFEKEAGDIDGSFALAVAIEEPVAGGDTRLVWYTTSAMMEASVDEMVAGSNTDLVLNALSWMTERENSISITPKNLTNTQLTMTATTVNLLGTVMIAVPVLILAVGIVVMVRRKRR